MPPTDRYEDRVVHIKRIGMGSISPEYTVYISPEIRKCARPRLFLQPCVANGMEMWWLQSCPRVSGLESPTQTEEA